MIDRNTNVQITDKALAFAKPMLSAAYLMGGKYHYSKGGSYEIIEKDTVIEEQIDLGNYIAVKIKGFDYGSFAVFDKKKNFGKATNKEYCL